MPPPGVIGLSQEADFKLLLPNKLYGSWSSYEENSDRILALKDVDIIHPINDQNEVITAEQAEEANDEKLDQIRINLRTVLSIVGKCVSEGHYGSVIQHSTSLRADIFLWMACFTIV